MCVSEQFTQEEIEASLEDDAPGMKLVERKYIDLDDECYVEAESYEKEIVGLTRAGYKTKIGTYTYRVRDKKTQTPLIKYVLTGKFKYNGKTGRCVEALGQTTHLVRNRYTVLNDSATASGNTAIGYFYCQNKKTAQTFGGTFKIRISATGVITYP